ncbi:MAG: sugar phosphate nucleotidyltransferase [Chloroflexota bacterium]
MTAPKQGLTSIRGLILAGGLGLRLRSVVSDRPKPLAVVGQRPFLEYLLRQISAQGILSVTICTGYGSDRIRQVIDQGPDWGLRIGYSEESEPLGTAGALRLAMEQFDDPEFIVLNGDSFFDISFERLMETHRSLEAQATIAVRWTRDAGRFGSVELDGEGRVLSFRQGVGDGPSLINGGIYVLNRSVLLDLPVGKAASLERQVFPALIRRTNGAGLGAATFDGWFTDIGVPDDYLSVDRDPRPILAAVNRASSC